MSDDLSLLADMLVSARRVIQYTQGIDQNTFRADVQLQDAVVHRLQIIGEASRRVSESFRTAHPQVPWTRIVGMRHRLVHDYLRTDLDIVWEVSSVHVPELIRLIEPLVPQPPAASEPGASSAKS